MNIIKNKIEMTHLEWVKIEYNKQDILVNPYISLSIKTELLRNYIDNYFKNEDILTNYIGSEYGLVLQIVDLCTSISIADEKGQIIIGIDDLIGSGLWEKITKSILNYESFRNDLSFVVEKIRKQVALDKSIGYTFDKIANRLFEVLNKFMEMDLSEQGISDLVNKLKSETVEYAEKFGNINPSTSQKASRKQRIKANTE